LLSHEHTRKVVSQIKPEKYSGGVWSLKRGEELETGVLLAVEVMFCE
jgi:hypothetical protein